MKAYNIVSLKKFNTFGIDVKAKTLVDCQSEAEVTEACKMAAGERRLVLGGGSNVLFLNDFDGIIIRPLINETEVLKQTGTDIMVRVGAGVVWDDFVAMCVERGWYGVENLSAIPGNVGASPVQNIGAYGAEAANAISSVNGFYIDTQKTFSINADACDFGYRQSIFKTELKDKVVITSVVFHLKTSAKLKLDYGDVAARVEQMGSATLANVRKAITEIRRAKLPDPEVEGNAGSFFKNPEVDAQLAEQLKGEYADIPSYLLDNGKYKIPAGWLIERCGWKGRTLGKAGVHARQALVLVNKGGASGADVMQLANTIVDDVFSKFGIRISMEVNLIK
ncbi:MAG: UDP-N-acetylmuramate dehydrogenase [Bacteroidales bacterium]|nr:UDP-N-acetylmuramate dehydrogenase [Bacteroidales bacterium]